MVRLCSVIGSVYLWNKKLEFKWGFVGFEGEGGGVEEGEEGWGRLRVGSRRYEKYIYFLGFGWIYGIQICEI